MTKQSRIVKILSDKQVRPNAVEPAAQAPTFVERAVGPIRVVGGGSAEAQARWFAGGRLHSAQQHTLAAQIGRVQGNWHLQRVMASLQQDAETTQVFSPVPEHQAVSCPIQRGPDDEPGGESPQTTTEESQPERQEQGTGEVQLDAARFQQLDLERALPLDRLLRPSPELLQRLVENWWLEYSLRHPPPPSQESAGQQIMSAWRRLTDEWIARGAEAITNPQMAQDLLRDQAAEAVIHPLTSQPSEGGEGEDWAARLGDVAGEVWPAFQRALEATQFYAQLRTNVEELAGEHWPELLGLVGTVLVPIIGTAAGGDWAGVEAVTQHALPLIDQEIPLGEGATLLLRFDSSEPIQGMGEQGVVIGVRPVIGVRLDVGEQQILIEGSANLRFETGQESERGFQVHAMPNLTVRW